MPRYTIGLDFGTESVRAAVTEQASGGVAGEAARDYPHGVIDRHLPLDMTGGSTVALPPDYALQHPQDLLTASADACRAALSRGKIRPDDVGGVRVAFAGATLLPAFADGTPVCLFERFKSVPLAWPKLWAHRAAKAAAGRITALARQRSEPWLDRAGGSVGVDSFLPKILDTLEEEPGVYDIADVWLDAGDWYVWQLTSGPFPDCSTEKLVRSTTQVGFMSMWNTTSGYPSGDFLAALHVKMAEVVRAKLCGTTTRPGDRAGALTPAAANLLGLTAGTPVSAAVIGTLTDAGGATES